jgi:hypothetical protein
MPKQEPPTAAKKHAGLSSFSIFYFFMNHFVLHHLYFPNRQNTDKNEI